MKEYYYLTGKDQNGPFTIEELMSKGLTQDTLVWSEGMGTWEKLEYIPDLIKYLNSKSTPPPVPSYIIEEINNTETSEQLKEKAERTSGSIKPSKKALTWLILWCTFHLFALLMSTSEIDLFNNLREPRTDKFWPLVEFVEEDAHFIPDDPFYYSSSRSSGSGNNRIPGKWEDDFNGIFVQYDWTEFAFYVGGALIIFLLVRTRKD